MSAYLVDSEHIAQIVYWAKQPGKHVSGYNLYTKSELRINTHENMAFWLAYANIDSIKARYVDAMGYSDDELTAFVDECCNKVKTKKRSMLTAADIWNMCQCLNYQCCEVDNWIETDAYWLIHNIQSQAASEMASDAKIKWSYAA